MAKTMNLGKVAMTTAGDYDSSKIYERLTCVLYNHVSWVSRKEVPAGIVPGTNELYWQKVSERGEQGIQGPVGPQGNSAFDGNGVEIVNNLTQGGEAAVLSAEQGKILDAKLAKVSAEVSELSAEVSELSAEVSELSYGNLPLVGGENAWIRHSNGEYVPSNAAKTYYFSTEHIKHIIAYLYTGASVVNVISFFSDIEATQESYMAEESIAWIGGDSDNWYVAKAPEKAKVVAVTSANNDSFTPLLYVSAGDYLGYISAKEEENFNAILKGWVESESFAYTSISKDGNGFVTQASIVYPNGATGILKITRDVDGNAIVVTATHILNSITKTITYSIKRDAEGQVISTTININ